MVDTNDRAGQRPYSDAEVNHVLREAKRLIEARPIGRATRLASLAPAVAIFAVSVVVGTRAFEGDDPAFGVAYAAIGVLTAATSMWWARSGQEVEQRWFLNQRAAFDDLQELMQRLDPVEDERWFQVAEMLGELARPGDQYVSLAEIRHRRPMQRDFGGS